MRSNTMINEYELMLDANSEVEISGCYESAGHWVDQKTHKIQCPVWLIKNGKLAALRDSKLVTPCEFGGDVVALTQQQMYTLSDKCKRLGAEQYGPATYTEYSFFMLIESTK